MDHKSDKMSSKLFDAARYNENSDVMKAMLETLDTEKIMTLLCMKNKDGWTPVLIAARINENADVMRAMLETLDTEQRTTLLCMKIMDEATPVHHAAGVNKKADVMKAMLETLDTEQRMTLLSMKTKNEWAPVLIAARNNENPDVMRAMLETLDTEKIITLLCMKTKNEWAPVHHAARYNENADVMRAMLETLDTEQRMTLLCMKNKDEWTAVHLAARYNENADVMRTMLETLDTEQRMTLLCMKTKNERTPVLLAARYNENADVMRAMLEPFTQEQKIALLSTKSDLGSMSLHLAAESSNNAEIVKVMLETLNMDQRMTLLSMRDNKDLTPIHKAAEGSALSMLDLLDGQQRIAFLCDSPDVYTEISLKQSNNQRMEFLQRIEDDGLTFLHLAARYSRKSAVMKTMLDWADMETRMKLLSSTDKSQSTPVHHAAKHNRDPEVVKELFRSLSNEQIITLLSMKNKEQRTPVHLAAQYNNNADVVLTLLDSVDLQQRVRFMCETVVMSVAMKSYDAEKKMMLLRTKIEDDWTPVHYWAQYNESADTVRIMLEKLDTGQIMELLCMNNKDGWTPVHHAAKYNRDAEVVKELFRQLSNEQIIALLSMKNKDQWTPVHLAAQYNNNADVVLTLIDSVDLLQRVRLMCESTQVMSVVKKLFDVGQQMMLFTTMVDSDWTPLHHLAQYSENADDIRIILESIDTEQRMTLLRMRNKNCCTPLHLAAQYNRNQKVICALLDTLDPFCKTQLLSTTNSIGENVLDLCGQSQFLDIFQNESLPTKIALLFLSDKVGAKLLHGLVEDRKISEVISFLSSSDGRLNKTIYLSIMIAARTGDIERDTSMTYKHRNHAAHIHVEGFCNDALFEYMAKADKEALSSLLDFLAEDQAIEPEYRLLIWVDKMDNNILHLAASVNHEKLIRKILHTEETTEINQALQKKNAKGLTPYFKTKTQSIRRLLAWSESQLGCYPLVTPPRVVIFFSNQDRPGSVMEKDSFVKILPKFNIEPRIVLNPTKEVIYNTIRESQTGDVSALIVVIMSHGDKGTVIVRDGHMPINKILMQMNPVALSCIPKILILQACQNSLPAGDKQDSRPSETESGQDFSETSAGAGVASSPITADFDSRPKQFPKQRKDDTLQKKPTDHYDLSGPDMAVLAATINEQFATRNLLIPLLAKKLGSSAPGDDLHQVFLDTTNQLRTEARNQVPEYRTTMRYKICLHKCFRDNTNYKTAAKLSWAQKTKDLVTGKK